jgi:uncharacterized RDD family membrane protein YckC
MAFFIDWIAKGAYILLISLTTGFDVFSKFNATLLMFIVFSPFLFYSFLLEWLNKGQTIGKMAMGIKVVGIHGNEPSISQCAIRWMFLLVDEYLFILFIFVSEAFYALVIFSPFVGCLYIGISQRNQRVGDVAAGTYLVKSNETVHSIFDTIYGYNLNHKKEYTPQFVEIVKFSDKDMTTIKNLLEKSELHFNDKLARKVAIHVKKTLNIESQLNDYQFLKQLLQDYNFLVLQKAEA